jgi:hypothetical protein
VSTATWVAAGLCAVSIGLLIGWGLRWAVLDARERRWQAEAADRWLAHRASLLSVNDVRNIEGKPE